MWSRDTLNWNCATRNWLSLGALGLLIAAGCGCGHGPSRAIAVVDGHDLSTEAWFAELVRKNGPEELVGMIDETIIRQEAARVGLSASKEAVEARIQEAAAYLGSQQALDARLTQLKMSKDDLRARAETAVLLDELAQRSIKLEEADIGKYYDAHVKEFRHGAMVKARMMLFATKANAEAVAQALKAGGDFAGLAKSLSEDPATAPDGGDMGWFEANRYAPAISKVAFALQAGQTSPVFQGPDGWYMIRAEQKTAGGTGYAGEGARPDRGADATGTPRADARGVAEGETAGGEDISEGPEDRGGREGAAGDGAAGSSAAGAHDAGPDDDASDTDRGGGQWSPEEQTSGLCQRALPPGPRCVEPVPPRPPTPQKARLSREEMEEDSEALEPRA